ncbi:MAG: EFR1 family ferrodoxin [Eubacteriaceae bacterium]|nr:EFR1 family ferrodoxin [Eubacteriaceae bacterium]
MLFYFTGTGNSQAAAGLIAKKTGDETVDMGRSLRDKSYEYSLSEGEAAGFVFPVYYGGLPTAVTEFISKMKLSRAPSYVYGVMTCGGSPAACSEMLEQTLSGVGLKLDASFGVKMPANFAIMYEPTSPEKEGPILEEAERKLEHIAVDVQRRAAEKMRCSLASKLMSAVMYPRYLKGRKTAPFHTNDKCVHCGICASRCPVEAIQMIDGDPTWVIDQCVFCMSCVRCGAIEYGDKLTDRYRYKHPSLRKGGGHDHDPASGGEASAHDHGLEGGHDHSSGGSDSCCKTDSASSHEHGSEGGHDHSTGGSDSCCKPDGASSHEHGSEGGHDHSTDSSDSCCKPDGASSEHGSEESHDHSGDKEDCCGKNGVAQGAEGGHVH